MARMTLPPITHSRRSTRRLVPSRYPAVGILDEVASPEDLEFVWELENWTNDRIGAEFGIIQTIPKEWIVGGPTSTVIMAAFCHPRPRGGRFNDGTRGACYCAFSLKTARAEAIYHHRTAELAEIGVFETSFI